MRARAAVANSPAASSQAGTIRRSRLTADREYSHIPPSDPTRQRITSAELAHSACVSRRPKVATPKRFRGLAFDVDRGDKYLALVAAAADPPEPAPNPGGFAG